MRKRRLQYRFAEPLNGCCQSSKPWPVLINIREPEAGKNKITAEIADYWMALQIVRESFKESMGLLSEENKQRLNFISNNSPANYKQLIDAWKISKASVSVWVSERVKDGSIDWCDNDGNEFSDENELKKAKRSAKAFIKIAETYTIEDYLGLPSPCDLTGDSDWKEDGKLFQLYDLQLNSTSQPATISPDNGVDPDSELDSEPEEEEQFFNDPGLADPSYCGASDEDDNFPSDFIPSRKTPEEIGIRTFDI